MKILLTGTHFTPAQALIEQLQKSATQQIVYVGRKSTREGDKTGSVESQVLPKLGVRFISLISGRLSRNFSFWTLVSLLKLPFGFLQSFWIVMKESPDVIVSFGGYLAFPIVFWGWWFSIPIVIHEQTLKLGLANWLSLPFAQTVALAFPIANLKNNPKVVVSGNPIRQAVLSTSKGSKQLETFFKSDSDLPLIVILGGNQGSHFINRLIGENLDVLTSRYRLIHQTGDSKFNDFDYLSDKQSNLTHKSRYLVSKWFETEDLAAILTKADMVVTRGGMNTLYELALRKKPALVIPIPTAVQKEQLQNAKFFHKVGLGDYLTQGEITDQVFLHRLASILRDKSKYQGSDQSEMFFLRDGDARLAQIVFATQY
jgi:UDP-N-acetylglucosamine--N-acetylmuramyl-(pentapeptide) pyrophosphoryl-undecaprenol N-acetylglucosamine transferase